MQYNSDTDYISYEKSDHFVRTISSPIFQGSTIIYKDYDDLISSHSRDFDENFQFFNRNFPAYGRDGNPTVYEIANLISQYENAEYTLMTNCGMSAVTTAIMAFLKSGDHVLLSDGIYSSTKRFIESILPRYGITFSYYDQFDKNGKFSMENLTIDRTKIIFFEPCASGTFEFIDIKNIVNFAKSRNIITIADNSLMTPYLLKPINFGIDIVIHSCTKFISGHSDFLLGSISTNNRLFKEIYNYGICIGNSVSSQNCYFATRGLKTLPIRIRYSIEVTKIVFGKIRNHEFIDEILHPYEFRDERNNCSYNDYAIGVPSLFTIVFKKSRDELGYEKIKSFFNSFKIFHIGQSWGGFSSLCFECKLDGRISSFTRKYQNKFCVRFYLGLEDENDLVSDLLSSFKKLI